MEERIPIQFEMTDAKIGGLNRTVTEARGYWVNRADVERVVLEVLEGLTNDAHLYGDPTHPPLVNLMCEALHRRHGGKRPGTSERPSAAAETLWNPVGEAGRHAATEAVKGCCVSVASGAPTTLCPGEDQRECGPSDPGAEFEDTADYWRAQYGQMNMERADWKRWCQQAEARLAALQAKQKP